jgi:NADH:ubiquinone oxidoreductase subunit 3 (subunit A)
MIGHPFWGYANIVFDLLVVFILPLAFAIRELILLRRGDRGAKHR